MYEYILLVLLNLCTVSKSIFTDSDEIDGNIGIGKIPNQFIDNLDYIVDEYTLKIPNMNMTTYHIWYNNNLIPNYVSTLVDMIQYDSYWNELCNKKSECNMMYMPEMTELYYSNPNKKTKNLYGAAANFDAHRDCFYQFDSIRLYRVLIGLTNGNNNTVTYFPTFKKGHKLNKGDYIVFDFDRTLHQVIKDNLSSTPRILLKMHYLVFERGYSDWYKVMVRYMYLYYDYVTRYILESGTDPETFYDFFMGLLSEYYINYMTKYTILIMYFISLLLISSYKYKVVDIVLLVGKVYCIVVTFYWLRYQLFDIK
jgi:hypothetical protein